MVIIEENPASPTSILKRCNNFICGLRLPWKLFAQSASQFGKDTVARYEFGIKYWLTSKINQFILMKHFERTSPCPDKLHMFSYVLQNYFQVFWKGLNCQYISMKNARGRNDVRYLFVHQTCNTWLHGVQKGRHLYIASQRDFTSLFCWKKLFTFFWSSVLSIVVSKLSHMKSSTSQFNYMYINTSVGSARPELTPCTKSKKSWMTASAPIYKSHKKMRLLKSWKLADARLRSFTRLSSFDPGLPDPR